MNKLKKKMMNLIMNMTMVIFLQKCPILKKNKKENKKKNKMDKYKLMKMEMNMMNLLLIIYP